MNIDLPLIENRKRRVDFDGGYRIEVEKVYLDTFDDMIIIRSEFSTFYNDQNIPPHFETYIHRKERYRKHQEKRILREIEKLAKGTNRATETSTG